MLQGSNSEKDLENNLWVCNSCGKHHKFHVDKDLIFFLEKNSYQIIDTPQPADDPLNWVDTKSYKDRLKIARKKTNQNCAVMIAKGMINGIEITAGAINFFSSTISCGVKVKQ